MPRPAGRRWARLRRSGSRATQVITRGIRGRRTGDSTHAGTQIVYPQPEHSWRRLGTRRTATGAALEHGTASWAAPSTFAPGTSSWEPPSSWASTGSAPGALAPGALAPGALAPGVLAPGVLASGGLAPGVLAPNRAPAPSYIPAPSRAPAPNRAPALSPVLRPAPGTAPAPASPTGPASVAEVTGSPVTIPLLPGERTPARRVKFALANACTVASLLLGMTAVFLAIDGDFRVAALALLACVVFDGCDGGLARKFDVASPFGAQMDSLADLSSFGVATGIVVFEWLVADGMSPILAGPPCALIAVCAAIRLARFNVSPKNGQFFCGVPTTMVAAVLALDILIGPHLPAGTQVFAITVYALAMVSSFPYAKLVRVVRLPLWVWALPAICAMISLPGTFAVIVGGYLVSGPMWWLYKSRRRLTARPA
jgi:CDP-diacylglycerol---serine O-phosphatidyltransferase